MMNLREFIPSKSVLSLLTVITLSTLFGCSRGSDVELQPMTGTVYNGKTPMSDVLVKFVPKVGRESFARTDANGEFTMIYGGGREGVVVGQHQVVIVTDDQALNQSLSGSTVAVSTEGAPAMAPAPTPMGRGKQALAMPEPIVRYPSLVTVESGTTPEPLNIDLSIIGSSST